MKRHEQPTFETAGIEQILDFTAAYKEAGYRFVQICAITRDTGCDVLYAFAAPGYPYDGLEGKMVFVPDGMSIPSITEFYPAAFVFENEAHDLFGIDIEGISIDFEGNFYQVAVAYPMNPRAAVEGESDAAAPEEAQGEEADHE